MIKKRSRNVVELPRGRYMALPAYSKAANLSKNTIYSHIKEGKIIAQKLGYNWIIRVK